MKTKLPVFKKRLLWMSTAFMLLLLGFVMVGWQYASWYSVNAPNSADRTPLTAAANDNENHLRRFHEDGKIRGVHYFGSRRHNEDILTPVVERNIEWVVLVPYANQQDYNKPNLGISRSRSNGNRPSRRARYTELMDKARDLDLQVMIKPHIWMRSQPGGKWRSDIEMADEGDWETWKQQYRSFVLEYARLSEERGLPVFCIGAELHSVVKLQSTFWRELIRDIRLVYSGKLTYGANWYQEYEDVSFWEDLDYIGIQAYFPLTKKEHPTVDELVKGWKPHVRKIEGLAKRYNKPILFTEIGYKSSCNAAIEPWAWVNSLEGAYEKVSPETQANCYEAFFRVFWEKDWFAGALFWEWKSYDGTPNSRQSINFTPYNKPAANVMAKWFGRLGKEVEEPIRK